METDELWAVLDSERAALADLVDSLDEDGWAVPSLCTGWTVREVAAHLALAPRVTLPKTLAAFVRARGNFDRMVDLTARRAATAPTTTIVADLRSGVGSRRLAPGQNLRHAVLDVLVHGQDVAIPLGRRHDMPLDAARESAEHCWGLGFPFHARRRLRGVRLVATDVDWSVGEGPSVSGPIGALLPLLAGRTATLIRLSGEGVDELKRRSGTRSTSHQPE